MKKSRDGMLAKAVTKPPTHFSRPAHTSATGVKLKVFRSLWGINEPLEEVLPKLKALDYAGIEASLKDLGYPNKHTQNAKLLADNGLSLIAGWY